MRFAEKRPPTSTLNPKVSFDSSLKAGTKAKSLISAWVELSRQPAIAILNLRGKLVKAGFPSPLFVSKFWT